MGIGDAFHTQSGGTGGARKHNGTLTQRVVDNAPIQTHTLMTIRRGIVQCITHTRRRTVAIDEDVVGMVHIAHTGTQIGRGVVEILVAVTQTDAVAASAGRTIHGVPRHDQGMRIGDGGGSTNDASIARTL